MNRSRIKSSILSRKKVQPHYKINHNCDNCWLKSEIYLLIVFLLSIKVAAEQILSIAAITKTNNTILEVTTMMSLQRVKFNLNWFPFIYFPKLKISTNRYYTRGVKNSSNVTCIHVTVLMAPNKVSTMAGISMHKQIFGYRISSYISRS